MTKKKKLNVTSEPMDLGAPRLAHHHKTEVHEDASRRRHLRVMDQAGIDQLLLKDVITVDQHSILQAFTRDLHNARMLGMKIVTYEVPISGGDPQSMSGRMADAMMKVGEIQKYLDRECGRAYREMLVQLCTMDKIPAVPLNAFLHSIDVLAKFYLIWNGGRSRTKF